MKLEKLQKRLREEEKETDDRGAGVVYFMNASKSLAEIGDIIMGSMKVIREDPFLKEKVGKEMEDRIRKTIVALFKIASFYKIDLGKINECKLPESTERSQKILK